MSKQLVKNSLNVDAARSFVYNVVNDIPYYIFAANSGEVITQIPTPLDTKVEDVNLYDNLLFGKRIKEDDIKLSVKRYNWQLGQVYDMYDDTEDLNNKRFYVATDTGLEVRVYKCLFNNNGAASTVEPFGNSTESFETLPDGYVWKYMYTISKFNMNRFSTIDYIPVIKDEAVSTAAKPGTIDVIRIIKAGAGYDNYLSGVFNQPDDIQVGNSLVYDIGAGSVNDKFYKNCMMKITSPGPQNGQYRLIVDYVVEGGRKLVTLDQPFEIPPVPGDGYEISPNVFIYDLSDTSTEQCFARAIIDANSGNNISRIEILNPGLNYRKVRAELIPDGTVGVTGNRVAEIRAIVSPDNGHGFDPEIELIAKYACISGAFNGNSEPIVANNNFSTFGVLKEPLYSNCTLSIDTNTVKGVFLPGETISRYKPIKLAGTVEVFANSLVIGSNTTLFDSLREDDEVIISNGLTNVFGQAKNINFYAPENANTQLIIPVESFSISVANVPFTQANCDIYLIEKKIFAECVEYNFNELQLTDVNPAGFEQSMFVLGEESFATAKSFSVPATERTSNTISYLTIAGRDFRDFDAFNQLTRLVGERENPLSTFIPNETLVQETSSNNVNDQPRATFHSFESVPGASNDYLYLTNIINTITVPGTISTNREANTQTRFIASEKYDGELVRDSGEILYIENINTIQRRNTQTELVKLILEF